MFEARIKYVSGRNHIIEANTIEMLKSKCKPYIDDEMVNNIEVVKIEDYGWLKADFLDEEELL